MTGKTVKPWDSRIILLAFALVSLASLHLVLQTFAVVPEVLEPPLPPAKPITFPPRDGTHLVLVTEAVDGDTVRFFWLIEGVGRLNGINAPELRDPGGQEAKAYLQKILPTKPIPARVQGGEKYGRTLLDLIIDGETAGQRMIKAGHAKPWDGKGRRP